MEPARSWLLIGWGGRPSEQKAASQSHSTMTGSWDVPSCTGSTADSMGTQSLGPTFSDGGHGFQMVTGIPLWGPRQAREGHPAR